MKKFLSFALVAIMALALPSFAMAKNKNKHKGEAGKVTAVTDTTITITKKKNGSETINVPANTPITTTDGSAAPKLSELVGKKVKVSETTSGTASSITVKVHKKHKKA
jgi:hypothetical protein